MLAALHHQADKDNDLIEKSSLWKEWLSFIFIILAGFLGGDPFKGKGGMLALFWASSYRAFYGASLAYLILLMISPDPKATISFKNPTKYIRGFLSLSLWVPIATLSYSLYLWHIGLFIGIRYGALNIKEESANEICETRINNGFGHMVMIFVLGSIASLFFATISYVFVEKPALEGRSVFSNKYKKNYTAI